MLILNRKVLSNCNKNYHTIYVCVRKICFNAVLVIEVMKMPIVAGQGIGGYCVDIVMCIDATADMTPIINEMKENAMPFYQ